MDTPEHANEPKAEAAHPDAGDRPASAGSADAATREPASILVSGRELLEIVIAVLLVLGVGGALLSLHTLRTRDMAPGHPAGESLLISRLTYQLRPPERGEIVLINTAQDPSTAKLRRVIGLPGETVELRGEATGLQAAQAVVNGRPLIEPYAAAQLQSAAVITTTQVIRLKPGEYLVMPDNRATPGDAPIWDVVEAAQFAGRAWLVVFPLDALSIVNSGAAQP